jgi:hypothetical protein
MRSYTEKAILNYTSSIILNYHNHYSSLDEHEEIFNELSGGVIYRVNNCGIKQIWGAGTCVEMLKDGMFYSFSEGKLVPVKPALRCVGETPHLTRALRQALSLNLEDLY